MDIYSYQLKHYRLDRQEECIDYQTRVLRNKIQRLKEQKHLEERGRILGIIDFFYDQYRELEGEVGECLIRTSEEFSISLEDIYEVVFQYSSPEDQKKLEQAKKLLKIG